MRGQVHTEVANFRASPVLLEKAASHARREGMSFSELVRDALRAKLRDAA